MMIRVTIFKRASKPTIEEVKRLNKLGHIAKTYFINRGGETRYYYVLDVKGFARGMAIVDFLNLHIHKSRAQGIGVWNTEF